MTHAATVADRAAAELLRFVAPGVLHGLGNSLFAIRGHAQLLRGTESEVGRSRGAILNASEKALKGLDVLRYLAAESEDLATSQAWILLHRLCDFLRIPLLERGVTLVFGRNSSETPMRVEGTALCQCVVELLRQLAERLPSSFQGEALVDLAARRRGAVAVAVAVRSGPAQLPFPVDLAGALSAAARLLEHHGVLVETMSEEQQVRLLVPAATIKREPQQTPHVGSLAAESQG